MVFAMDQFEQQLEDLTQQGNDLGESMRLAAAKLQFDGEIPTVSLVEQMKSYRDFMEETRSQLFEEVHDEDLQTEKCQLDLLRGSFDKYSVRAKAFEVLDQIPLLQHREDADYIPLQECKAVAKVMQENIEKRTGGDLPADVQALIEGQHPLCALLVLVKGADTLDDETWSLHNETLTVAFGRQLATTVARGKLDLSGDENQVETFTDATAKRDGTSPQKEESPKSSSHIEA